MLSNGMLTLNSIKNMKGRDLPAIILVIACLAGGCATPPPPENKEDVATFKEFNDPYEPFNRTMLDFNLAIDKAVVRPITSVYRQTVPDPLKDNLHNFIENLRQTNVAFIVTTQRFSCDRGTMYE